jgi:hypothetical protein
VQHRERVVAKDELLAQLWPNPSVSESATFLSFIFNEICALSYKVTCSLKLFGYDLLRRMPAHSYNVYSIHYHRPIQGD